MKFRTLSKEKLLETAERIAQRIAERLPQSGLSEVAAEVTQVTREAPVRAEQIRRPNIWLRAGLAAVAILAGLGIWLLVPDLKDQATVAGKVYHMLDASKGAAIYLGAFALSSSPSKFASNGAKP